MNLKITTTILTLSLSSFYLTGCGQETAADLIAEAQYCLDKSTATTAQNCAKLVKSLSSAESYIIRCSADFIEQGFDSPTKLSDALNSLSNGGANTAAAMLSQLTFTFKPTSVSGAVTSDANNADQTFSYCNLSGQKGLSMVAMLAKTATQIAGLGKAAGVSAIDFSNPASIDTTAVTQAMNAIKNDPAAQTAVGGAVQATYTSTCSSGSQTNKEVCDLVSSAAASQSVNIQTATPAQIGAAILAYWQNH